MAPVFGVETSLLEGAGSEATHQGSWRRSGIRESGFRDTTCAHNRIGMRPARFELATSASAGQRSIP